MTRQTTICLAAAVIIASAMPAAAATDKTCLTGNDPAVSNDAAQIAALESAIDEACPCGSYDGERGATHHDYVRCAATRVKAAVKASALRSQCGGRLSSAYRLSTCGIPAARGAVPCVQRSASGKQRCLIVPAAVCQDRPGRYSRVACADYSRCVDAGDTNEDHRVDENDSSSCVPTPTPTETATPTATLTGTPTGTPTCGSEPPVVHVRVNDGTDNEEDVTLPPQAIGICQSQTPSGGGCTIHHLDGSAAGINRFDASESLDPRSCGQDPQALSFKWEILFTPTLQGALYASTGISGYLTPALTIQPSSLPIMEDTDAGADTYWRVRLTVTSQQPPITQSVVYFRFKYLQSELYLFTWTNCQLLGHFDPEVCPIAEAMNGMPTTEPH